MFTGSHHLATYPVTTAACNTFSNDRKAMDSSTESSSSVYTKPGTVLSARDVKKWQGRKRLVLNGYNLYVYIYIYIEREIYCTCLCIHIYTHTYVYM